MYLSNTSDHFGTSIVVYILLNPIKSQIFNFNKVLNDLDVECSSRIVDKDITTTL